MKILNQKKLPFPVFSGTPEETRDLAITAIIQVLGNSNNPPAEAFTTLNNLVNQKFLETPTEALVKDLQTLESRIRSLETMFNVRDKVLLKNATQRG